MMANGAGKTSLSKLLFVIKSCW